MAAVVLQPADGKWRPLGAIGETIIPPRTALTTSFLQGLTPLNMGARHPQYVAASTVLAINTRVRAQAQVALSSIRIALPNYYGNEEPAPSFSVTYTAAIEKYGAWINGGNLSTSGVSDANETFYRLSFNGKTSVRVSPCAKVLSDPITVSIPAGGYVYVRVYATIPSGAEVGIPVGKDMISGFYEFAETNGSTSDKTGGGQLITSGAAQGCAPIAIIGTPASGITEVRRVGIVGDSICYGTADGNKLGYVEQALTAAGIPCYNTGRSTGTCDQFMHPYKGLNRRECLWDCTHIICEMGTNDIGNGTLTAANYLLRQQSYLAMWQAMATIGRTSGIRPVWQCTVIPRMTGNTSSDTPYAGTTGAYGRTVWNDWLRAGAPTDGSGNPVVSGGIPWPYLTGIFDAADAVEANSSGVLTRNGTYFQNWTTNTAEGLHPNSAGHTILKAAILTGSLT